MEAEPSSSNSRAPEATVFYSIFPDTSLQQSPSSSSSSLHALHLQILDTVSPYLTDYIWQHEPFTLNLSTNPNSKTPCSSHIPQFHGKTKYGDNLEDEWFIVFLLFEISRKIPSVSIRVWDTDGEFLLIEAAFSLPRWINPENTLNRVFIRHGDLCIIPKERFPMIPSLFDALLFIMKAGEEARALDSVQLAVKNRISGYPERARLNVHRVRVRVPASVAMVLKHEPCLISLAVECFYDRDIYSMKYAAKMEKFVSGGTGEELVQVSIRMNRAIYAQLMQQTFQVPKCYPMPMRSDSSAYLEAELGMKITCGFEMMYQQILHEGLVVKGGTWDAYRESLESSGYFKGLLPGSKEYRRLMENAQEYYRNSSTSAHVDEAATLSDIDRFLFENFNSLYMKMKKKNVHENEDNNSNGFLFESPRLLEEPLEIRPSNRFFVSTGTSSSLVEETRLTDSTFEEIGSNGFLFESPRLLEEPLVIRPSNRFFVSTGTSSSLVEETRFIDSTFEEIGSSSTPKESIRESTEIKGVNLPEDSIAVLTSSPNPYEDFRKSMEQMIEVRSKTVDWDFMGELLVCFLRLNDKNSYKYILEAFVDLVVNLRQNSEP